MIGFLIAGREWLVDSCHVFVYTFSGGKKVGLIRTGRIDFRKSKKTVCLGTFKQDRGGNRLQICAREVIFARFNYSKLVKYQPPRRVVSLGLPLDLMCFSDGTAFPV
ncbi:MAG TPA: hypothetical protein DCM07_26900 [Planctomycetaceae bacterium]|nr:hypothetical protein [Gimesia sp.]HAH48407.1 hypothetical protein [Planctomycetaceae bacterium]HBL45432.1 hypothetical protein [Planctomycetaceae bacterium]|tara:strand:+ start:1998 stop:2318 length:321 start_codon:yes stop_codon:yes gene_type:complete